MLIAPLMRAPIRHLSASPIVFFLRKATTTLTIGTIFMVLATDFEKTNKCHSNKNRLAGIISYLPAIWVLINSPVL
jgi:hypothetical protein